MTTLETSIAHTNLQKKTRKNPKNSQKWRYDAEYIRYVESGESAAVFVVRDVVQAINTSGKWIDIISLDCYDEEPDGKAFNWIVCELFPRKIQPQYIDEDTDYNRYITWKTAHDDISQQRRKGGKGPKFLVLCRLINHNKGKFVTLTLAKITRTYHDSDDEVWEFTEPPEEKETVKAPLAPDWKYRITFLKRLTDEQAEYIKSHEVQIRDNIDLSGKATPEIMGITSQPKKETKKHDEPSANNPANRKS